MIYLELFLSFLKIGAVAFGGGYGMISFIRDECLTKGWLTEEGVMDLLAISESTPGPVAVNAATFVGSSQGGFLGAVVATFGVILPAFIIMFAVCTIMKKLLKFKATNAILSGIRPVVTGLVTAVAAIFALKRFFGFSAFGDAFSPDAFAFLIMGAIIAVAIAYKLLSGKSVSPIILIILSGILGVVCYGI